MVTGAPSGRPRKVPVTEDWPETKTYTASAEMEPRPVLVTNEAPLSMATAPETVIVSDEEQSPSVAKSTAKTEFSSKLRLAAVIPQEEAPVPPNSKTEVPRTCRSARLA